MQKISPSQLLDLLDASFNAEEAQDIALRLNVDWDNLAGQTKRSKLRELIMFCARQDRVDYLLAAIASSRPGLLGSEIELVNDELSRHSSQFTKRWVLWVVVAACTLFVLVILAVSTNMDLGNSPLPAQSLDTATPSHSKTQAMCSASTLLPNDVSEEITIPAAGKFLLGDASSQRNLEREQRWTTIRVFSIDRYETTHEQYQQCVAVGACKAPEDWEGMNYPLGNRNLPVINVSLDDAKAYCEWAGKRLPTEDEWEYACRGAAGYWYPWGNTWQACLSNSTETGFNKMLQVGSFSPAGDSAFGVADMVGNAVEWTQSMIGDSYVLRGGSWADDALVLRCTSRETAPPEATSQQIGFRCAQSQSQP